jgi:hypothetical protein
MKNTFKYLSAIALSGMVCLSLALPASAQRNGNSGGSSSRPSTSGGGGGGGGGYHPSSSGGGGSSYRPSTSSGNSGSSYRPSNGGGNYRPSVGVARPSYGGGGNYRPSVNNPRVAIAPPRVNSQGIRPPVNRIGVNTPAAAGYRGYVSPNGTNVIGTRGYVGQGGRASVGVGGRGFYPSGYWGQHHYYHYYHGYYNTYYAPRLGFSIGFLPYGYYPFFWDDYQYYYCNGLFYTYDNNEYTVVEPPIGAEVNELPSNAQSIVINGEQYYEANGVYYKPIVKDDGTTSYEVAGKDGQLNTDEQQGNDNYQAPQIGDVVAQLPPDCRKININGEKYYVSPDGYYYQETKDQNGNKVYKIVGTPDDEPNNQ